jgi:hypothetical protein
MLIDGSPATLAKRGPKVEVLNKLPKNVQHLVGRVEES